jgi:hypothetical protein
MRYSWPKASRSPRQWRPDAGTARRGPEGRAACIAGAPLRDPVLNDRLTTPFLSLHVVEPVAAGLAWQRLGRTLPRPRAVLVLSARWESSQPTLSGNSQPTTVHDSGGSPPALYRLSCPAPGAPDLAALVVGGFANGALALDSHLLRPATPGHFPARRGGVI